MPYFLNLYLEYKCWIDFSKDLVFFAGAYVLFKYLYEKRFNDARSNIETNLMSRKRLKPLLDDFVYDSSKNTKDISVRFVHWKNYPWRLDDDAYKFNLYINYLNETPHYGWIDNTGINVMKPVWWYGHSVYVNKNYIFFIDEKELSFNGFKEFHDCVLVFHLPYTNIVNFDFVQFIEYDPVLYIRHPYYKLKKLYDNKIILKEKEGCNFLRIELSQHKMLRKYTTFRFLCMIFKLRILTTFHKDIDD